MRRQPAHKAHWCAFTSKGKQKLLVSFLKCHSEQNILRPSKEIRTSASCCDVGGVTNLAEASVSSLQIYVFIFYT